MKHNPKTREIADKYAKSKGLKLNHESKPKFSPERAKLIAKAFDQMKHDPTDPKVQKAYQALIKETVAQYQHLKKHGLKVTAITPDMKNPYPNSEAMRKDVAENHHLYFYPTDLGFGGKDDKTGDHPLLQKTSEKHKGKTLVANDLFRIVHDYFGHTKEGTGFGPKGEEGAWHSHMQMYSPEAQKALTSETRGQNSWVNFGPHGEENQANPQNTQYAEQKAGLLPDWALESEEEPKYAKGGKVNPDEVLRHIETSNKDNEAFDKDENKEMHNAAHSHQWSKERIPVSSLRNNGKAPSKPIYEEDQAASYATKKSKAPHIVAVRDGNTHTIVDGVRRARAAHLRGDKHIDAYVGTPVKKFAEGTGPIAAPIPSGGVAPTPESSAPTDFDSIQTAPTPESSAAPTDFDSIQTAPQDPTAPKDFDSIEDHDEGRIPNHRYMSAGQKLLAGVEAGARGVTAGMSDAAMIGARGIADKYSSDPDFWAPSAEDIRGRKEANPEIAATMQTVGTMAGLLRGVGAPGAITKVASKLTPQAATWYGKMGAAALNNMIVGMGLQAGDEVSKGMIGQGNAQAPVSSALAHIGSAGLFNAGTGALFNGLGQGGTKSLQMIENAKLGTKASELLAGMGIAARVHANGVPEHEAEAYIKQYADGMDYKAYKPGIDLYFDGINHALNKATKGVVDFGGGILGGKLFGLPGYYAGVHAAHKYFTPVVGKLLEKPLIGATNKLAIPTIMYALSKGQTSGLFTALDHASKIAKGSAAVTKGIDAIFKAGTPIAIDFATDKQKKATTDYIDKGGITQEMQDSLNQDQQPMTFERSYAEGGPIDMEPVPQTSGSIADLYPEQDMMLNAAKARISNYLTSLKPQPNQSKLPFDNVPDNREAELTYKNAIEIAAAPLSIFHFIKDGDIQAEQVRHFTSMYPELYQHLNQALTERIMNAQLNSERPDYKTRLGLSVFMGTALDGTMIPTSITSAQNVHAKNNQMRQPQQGPHDANKLGKSNNNYRTTSQAAESDRNSRE